MASSSDTEGDPDLDALGQLDTGKKLSKSREFLISQEIGELKGLVSSLQDKVTDLEGNKTDILNFDTKPVIMASTAKNKLTFSGRENEDIEEVLTRIEFMTVANSWNDQQKFGQILWWYVDDNQ